MYIQQPADDRPFPGLSDMQKHQIAPFFQTWKCVAGDTVFEQGQLARSFYVIHNGEVLIRYKPYDGPSIDVTRLASGQVLAGLRRSATPLIRPVRSASRIARV